MFLIVTPYIMIRWEPNHQLPSRLTRTTANPDAKLNCHRNHEVKTLTDKSSVTCWSKEWTTEIHQFEWLVQLGRPKVITRYSVSWQASINTRTKGKLHCKPSHHRHDKTLLEQEPVASLRASAICFASWAKSPSNLAPAKVRRDSSIVRVWTGRHVLLRWDERERFKPRSPGVFFFFNFFYNSKTPPGSLVNVI